MRSGNMNGIGTTSKSTRRRGQRKMQRAMAAVMQPLEPRLQLSTYNVPSGTHTAVYLKEDTVNPGRVQVFLDSPAGTPVATLTDTSDTINASSYSGFHFYDYMEAQYKPSGGIHFHAGSGSYLQVGNENNRYDQVMGLISSTSSGGQVSTTDYVDGNVTAIDYYDSTITHLTIRTSDYAAGSHYDESNHTGDGTNVHVLQLNSSTSLLVDTGDGTYDTVELGRGDDVSVEGAVVHTGAGNDTVILNSLDFDVRSADVDGSVTAHITFASGTGNSLVVGPVSGGSGQNCTAYLSGPVDTASVGNQGSLIVENPSTIGDMTEQFGAQVNVEAASTIDSLSIDGNSAASVQSETSIGAFDLLGVVTFTGTSGASTINTMTMGAADLGHGELNVDYGSDVTVTDSVTVDALGQTALINADYNSNLSIDTLTVGGNGTLDINLVSTANVSVDTFNIEANSGRSGTVYVNDGGQLAVGTCSIDSGEYYGDLEVNSGAVVVVDTFDVDVPMSGTPGVVNVNAGGDLTVLESSRLGVLNVHGAEAFVHFQTAATSVDQHVITLSILSGGRVDVLSRYLTPETGSNGDGELARVIYVHGSLDLGDPTGTLDLTNNDLVVDYASSTPLTLQRYFARKSLSGMDSSCVFRPKSPK